LEALQQERTFPESCLLRQCKYLNNYEAIHMISKGQLEGIAKRDVLAQNRVINQMFGLAS
jgi:hypothetical protein